MKRIVIFTVGILALMWIGYWVYDYVQEQKEEREHREWVAGLEHSASENVQILEDTVLIDYLGEKRTLSVYLPAGYSSDTNRYSVIYFFDGQSLFDQKILEGQEWGLDEHLDSLGKVGGPQSIVIGIYNSDDNRLTEYKPFPAQRPFMEKVVSGDKHSKWLVEKLKPWVDNNFRTKPEVENTFVGGASLGGLMSYYCLMEFPDVFGGAIVFSPSFWVHEKVYRLHEKVPNLNTKKIFFNAGELETPTVDSVIKMHGILLASGIPEENMKYSIEEGLGHWHISWKNGFPKAYPWIVN